MIITTITIIIIILYFWVSPVWKELKPLSLDVHRIPASLLCSIRAAGAVAAVTSPRRVGAQLLEFANLCVFTRGLLIQSF